MVAQIWQVTGAESVLDHGGAVDEAVAASDVPWFASLARRTRT